MQAGIFDDRVGFPDFWHVLGRASMAATLAAFAAPAHAEKRVALVVGNNDYRNVPKLQKAVNDARTMGDTLKQLGFTVMVAENQSRQAFSQTLLAFDKAVEPGDTAFFFFAGHGFEIAGQNFLLPTDVPAATEGQEELVRDASILADRIIERLQNRKVRTAILVFDACRNNPFERAGHPCGRRRRRAGADDAIAGRRVLDVLGRSPADRARPSLQRRRQSQFGVHAHLRQGADAARREPRSGRAAHAAARQRNGGDRPPQADPGLFRPDGRRRVPQRHRRKASPRWRRSRPNRRRSSRHCRRCSTSKPQNDSVNAPIAMFSRHNGGWTVVFSIADPTLGISWRMGEAGDFRETGFIDTLDPRTRKRMPNPSIELSADAPAATIQVRYVDTNGDFQGPFPIRFDPEAALIRDQRKILDMTATSWLSFREFNGLLVYYTHLMSYRCAIREVRVGIDSTVPDKVLKMPPCDPRDPSVDPARSDALSEARARRPGRSRWS